MERACAANAGQPWERGNLPAYGKAGFVPALCKERRFTALRAAPCWGHPAAIPHLSSVFQEIAPKVKFLQLPRPQQRPGTSLLSPSLPQLLPADREGSRWLLPGGMGSPSSPIPSSPSLGKDRDLSAPPAKMRWVPPGAGWCGMCWSTDAAWRRSGYRKEGRLAGTAIAFISLTIKARGVGEGWRALLPGPNPAPAGKRSPAARFHGGGFAKPAMPGFPAMGSVCRAAAQGSP